MRWYRLRLPADQERWGLEYRLHRGNGHPVAFAVRLRCAGGIGEIIDAWLRFDLAIEVICAAQREVVAGMIAAGGEIQHFGQPGDVEGIGAGQGGEPKLAQLKVNTSR